MNGHARFLGSPWMIRPEAFRALCSTVVSARALAGVGPSGRGGTFGDDNDDEAPPYQMVGSTAVINLFGPIYRRSTMMDDCFAGMFGGVCLETIDEAVTTAVNDPAVKAILLDIDSPGGEAAGIGEMAGKIRQAASLKPTAAYVEACCCSAAYWLASATGEIVAAPTAIVGSIGTVMVLVDDSGFQEQMGIKEYPVVSSQSPDKWPDVATEKGRSTYQPIVDALSSVFISDVAAYRDTTTEAVLRDFGKGGVLVGDAARKAGMVDKIASKEATLRKLSGANRARLATIRPAGQTSVSRPTPIRARLITQGRS